MTNHQSDLQRLCKMTGIPAWKIKKLLVTSEEWKKLTNAAKIIEEEKELKNEGEVK